MLVRKVNGINGNEYDVSEGGMPPSSSDNSIVLKLEASVGSKVAYRVKQRRAS